MTVRTVVIVGASSGIGREVSLRFAAAGDHVVLLSRSPRALDRIAKDCLDAGAASAAARPVDVRDAAEVDAIFSRTVNELGRLDIVVHSAGVVAYGRFEEIPADVFNAVLETNVSGAANVARAALPVMRNQRRGHLILVGSVLGNIAVPGMTPYVMSKYALRSLGRQLSLENRDRSKVTITVVSPGSVDTPIYQLAANYLGRAGRPPAPVNSAQKVANAIMKVVERPQDRVSVGLANPLMRLGFTFLPAVFDVAVGPLFRLAGLKPGPQQPTSGNVFSPLGEQEKSDGGEGQGAGDLAGRILGR